MRGALLMTGAMAAFTFNDACMKALGVHIPLFQALVLRGLGTTILLLILARRMGQLRFDLSREDWTLIAIRTAAEAGAAWLFLTALNNMSIASVSAILQSLPLTVTLASAMFLGEVVGWRRLLAIMIGFGGVLLIVKPGTDAFTIHSLYALGSVICVTIRDVVVRKISKSVPSLVVSLAAAIGVTLFSAAGAAFVQWQPMGLLPSLQLIGATLFVVAGYILSVSSMRVGEIGFVAPFRYTSLLVALILGVVVFGSFPDLLTLIGAAIVVATGVFTLLREWQLRQAGRRSAPPPRPVARL
ncbi:EamA-like transporter family protein [Flavimaricola marinus]|uniref:EamA-like transporter family protein n=2 Tax=Flavimaricola marinus TaxID=1819565 RepID=A0A238LA20_9RHOB|nr:EamA-like transporter family protein [Flavimaricola marinus]